jgi:hypothetical protein
MQDHRNEARRAIRGLADLAYERELARELAKVRANFNIWSAGQMTSVELAELVHQFHDGVSRQLYNRYSAGSTLSHAVAMAVVRGTISATEIPELARKQLDQLIALFSEIAADA